MNPVKAQPEYLELDMNCIRTADRARIVGPGGVEVGFVEARCRSLGIG